MLFRRRVMDIIPFMMIVASIGTSVICIGMLLVDYYFYRLKEYAGEKS